MLAEAVDALPQSERTVISLYYYEGLTLKEIGRVLGVTESRACQIHGKAVIRLRAHVQSLLALPGAPPAGAKAPRPTQRLSTSLAGT
jgi:DNA-directed RNA polymerase specialized sigma24 family protein